MLDWPRGLLLKQVFKCLSGVGGARGGRSGGLFLSRHADFIKRAIVAGVFLGDALFDRLHAFKAAAGIEIHALFARVQLEAALGTETGRGDLL